MMNEATVNFIRAHADDDVRQLALKGSKDPDVDLPLALDQIAGRQIARRKLPTWAASDGILYPPHLSMEQCSSEQTARYKARLAGSGQRMVDLTGGFGVDFSFLAPSFQEAIYVERQSALCDIARHNFQQLGLRASVINDNAEDYLRQMPRANLIYIDPARRDRQGQRTYDISDCTPDVLELRDLLLEKADRVIVKLSPMLDWRKAVADLSLSPTTHDQAPCVSEVHIVSVGNECKELLLVLEKSGERVGECDMLVRCVNILADGTLQIFDALQQPTAPLSPPSTFRYLYEPNASIMKAGCFEAVSETFHVSPLAPNSHLFVSDSLIDAFPGRTFIIDNMTTMNKRELRAALTGVSQANITVRNFPLTVAQLRSRLKLNEGGSLYIFATTLADNRHVLFLTRRQCTEPQNR